MRLVHGRVEDRGRVQTALAVHDIQAVLHLAGPTDGADPDHGTAAVLTAVRDHNRRLPVVAARPLPTTPGLRADADPLPPAPWGVAQFGEVFGGGDRKTFRVVPATVVALLTGDRPPPAEHRGPRDFIHAADAARACLALAEALADGRVSGPAAVAFRTGWTFSDRDLAAAVQAVVAGAASLPALAADPPDAPLGWVPQLSPAQALHETVAWYRDFLRTRFFGTRSVEPPHRAAA